jgi:hypothetical protein
MFRATYVPCCHFMIQHLRDYRPTVWHTRYTTYPACAKEFILDASQPSVETPAMLLTADV